jgi:UDP-N-acetylglucosamine--N-acetylmuramyl-(pentapeptide) pyrophosphoryl-undecaprenol N-acetylglucosamine transferase
MNERNEKSKTLRVGVACGGTGGHIFPGLATAEVLRDGGHTVTLWLAGKDIEARATELWGGPSHVIKAQGLPGGFSLRSLKAVVSLLQSVGTCLRKMRCDKPDVLLAMGSYASVGPVLAARLLRVPVVLHEANVMPGKAIRFLTRHATCVAAAFPETQRHLSGCKLQVTGMPLRRSMVQRAENDYPERLDRNCFTFLVTGGSRGAHRLNEVLSQAFVRMRQDGLVFQVIHLTGADDQAMVNDCYKSNGVIAQVQAFEHRMAMLYNAADFAICRAGAATCAELAISGTPALFVPYPHAGNHQALNARVMEETGMAGVIEEAELSVGSVAAYLTEIINTPSRVAAMSAAAKKCARSDAAEQLAELVCSAAHENKSRS